MRRTTRHHGGHAARRHPKTIPGMHTARSHPTPRGPPAGVGRARGNPDGAPAEGKCYVGWSDSKTPPWWEASLERVYPFRRWEQDVVLWHSGTELSDELVGPAIARRLGGTAADLVRSLNVDLLRSGHVNLATGVHDTGMSLLLQPLQDRHGKFPVDLSTSAIVNMLWLGQNRTEIIDDTLSRYENLRTHVKTVQPGIDLPVAAASWILMEAWMIPKSSWPLLSQWFGGTLPTNEEAMIALMTQIRQQGHIMEADSFRRPGEDTYYGEQTWYDDFSQIAGPSDAQSLSSARKVGARHAPTAARTLATKMATTSAAPLLLSATRLRRRRLTNSLLLSPLPRTILRTSCGTPNGLLGGAIVRLPAATLDAGASRSARPGRAAANPVGGR
ncbi:hypothetical protein N9L68_03280 [bacterium]|nr:hypothetical protein [bacterium]